MVALSFDTAGEYLASCAAGGRVVIRGLFTDSLREAQLKQPLTAVALDPRFAGRKTREWAVGSRSGAVTLCSLGWLGRSETVLHTGARLKKLAARFEAALMEELCCVHIVWHPPGFFC